MSATLLLHNPTYALSLEIHPVSLGHHLEFTSFVPTARRPEHQVRYQATLSTAALRELHAAIGRALAAAVD